MSEPQVAVVMGSDSDWPVMSEAVKACAEFGIACHKDVVSAHRMPDEMLEFGRTAADRGFRVIIAGAGGAAHLPGMLAAVTPLPVIGVPVPLARLDGLDSLLVHRADARRRAGGHRGHRERAQRRVAGGADPGRVGRGSAAAHA